MTMIVPIYQRSTLVATQWEEWCMIECLKWGTKAMRLAGNLYLPQWPLEDNESYQHRLNTSFLFNAFGQTIESLSGRPFSEQLKINDDVPPQIAEHLDDVDLEGRSLHNFAHDVLRTALSYGHTHLLVDFPSTTGAATQADLQKTGARPYIQHIFPQQVLYWNAERINGVMTLTELRIWELVSGQGGLFSTLPCLQVRVLKPDSFEVWQPIQGQTDSKKQEWHVVETGPNTLGKIPVVTFYAERVAYMISRPPLLDLAYMNVEHWQSASDQRSILHTARVPLLTAITDETDFTLTAGAKSIVRMPIGSTLSWVETQGHAIAAGATDLQDLIDRMQLLGAEMVIRPMGRRSATEAAILSNKSESRLGAITRRLQAALNDCLALWAEWIGAPEGGTVEIFQDFGVDDVSGISEPMLLQAAVAGKISDKLFFNELQRRGTLSGDADYDDDVEARANESISLAGGGMDGNLPKPPIPYN